MENKMLIIGKRLCVVGVGVFALAAIIASFLLHFLIGLFVTSSFIMIAGSFLIYYFNDIENSAYPEGVKVYFNKYIYGAVYDKDSFISGFREGIEYERNRLEDTIDETTVEVKY